MNPSAPPQVHKQNFQEAVPHVHTAATPEPSTRDLAPSTPDPTRSTSRTRFQSYTLNPER